MDNKFILIFVSLICLLICVSPIVAAENSALSDYVLLDWNPFADHSNDLTIKSMFIHKVKKIHTDSEGNTKKSADYYLRFNVTSNLDSMNRYDVEVTCLDKNGDVINTIDSYIDSEGKIKIPLEGVSGVKSANVTIKDDSGNVIFENSTSKIKVSEKVTKDKPVEPKTTETTSSGQTYWASANSNKFHYPSCEWAQKISGKNKIVFHSREEALNSGYSPCQVCGP